MGENQFSRRRRINRTKEQRDAWRERVQVGKLMQLLEDAGHGRVELSPNRIKSIEVVLDRLVPRLSSAEVVEPNELDSLSREEILARIQALFVSDPTLLPELIALNARAQSAAPSAVADPPRATQP